jgi:hypothetical protein
MILDEASAKATVFTSFSWPLICKKEKMIDLLVRYVLPSPDRKHTKHHRYCQPQFLIRLEKIWLRTNMFFEHMVYEAETEISTIIL